MSETNRRESVVCPRCRAIVGWPDLTGVEKGALADVRRADMGRAITTLHDLWGFDLADAKTLIFHVTREPGKCHRCGRGVSGDVSICDNCRSANLDWQHRTRRAGYD